MKPKLDTVGDLIAHLKKLDPRLPIGRIGHFGEFFPMDIEDFWVRISYITESGDWRDRNKTVLDVLDILPPDIGEDPD